MRYPASTLLVLAVLLVPMATAQGPDHQAGAPGDDPDYAALQNGTSDPTSDDTTGSSGNDAVVWIIVVAALIVLVYAYGRMKKPESGDDASGAPKKGSPAQEQAPAPQASSTGAAAAGAAAGAATAIGDDSEE